MIDGDESALIAFSAENRCPLFRKMLQKNLEAKSEEIMILLVTYVFIIVVGDAAAVGIATLVENHVSKGASLIVFFALFFLVFWRGWLLAVRLTAPDDTPSR
jgi:hypothetical protein